MVSECTDYNLLARNGWEEGQRVINTKGAKVHEEKFSVPFVFFVIKKPLLPKIVIFVNCPKS